MMKDFISNHKTYIPYIIVSFFAVIWNLLTMHNALPWCDEVMLVDTPANMYFYGEWATTAYNRMGEGTIPFATYMPLYIWSVYVWICVFGFSFLKVRTFELLTAAIFGGFVIKCMNILNAKRLTVLSSLVFSILFWFAEIMCLTYRMARPDMLGALMSICLIIYVIKSLKADKKCSIQIVAFSCLALLSGIQIGVFLIACLFFALFIVRPIKQLIRPAILSFCGFVIALLIAFSYMAFFGEVKAFFFAIIDASNTAHNIWLAAREYVLPMLGRTVKALPPTNTDSSSFLDGMMDIFKYASTLILLVSSVFSLCLCIYPKKKITIKLPIMFLCFGLFIILFYNIAGRFQTYYQWTAIIPIIACLSLIIDKKPNLIIKIVSGITCVLILVMGVRLMGNPQSDTYDNIITFTKKQKFGVDDTIATICSTYYTLKPQHRHAYWYEVYPTELIKDVDYILYPQPDKDKELYHYVGSGSMRQYLSGFITSNEYIVEATDSISEPTIVLYHIKNKKKN